MSHLQYSRLKSMNFHYPEVFPKGAGFLRQIDAVNIVIFYVCRLPLYNGEL